MLNRVAYFLDMITMKCEHKTIILKYFDEFINSYNNFTLKGHEKFFIENDNNFHTALGSTIRWDITYAPLPPT